MGSSEIRKATEQRMTKSVDALKADLAKVRTGRVHTGILDHVKVDYYGNYVPVPQIASVSLLDARTLIVTPWEKKMVAAVEKSIRESDLGLNPAIQGESIRVPMPPLTEERRKDLAKVVRGEGENARVAIRNLRRDANSGFKELLKKKQLSEDDERRAQEEIQKLTDKSIAEIDKLISAKEVELMSV